MQQQNIDMILGDFNMNLTNFANKLGIGGVGVMHDQPQLINRTNLIYQ